MLFSAISRNAAGTSIFGMSNFGSSKEGISNAEGMDLADFAFVVVAASAMGFIQKGRFPNTLRTLRPLKLVRCSGFSVVRRSDLIAGEYAVCGHAVITLSKLTWQMTQCNRNYCSAQCTNVARIARSETISNNLILFQECDLAASMACLVAVWPSSFACSDNVCI